MAFIRRPRPRWRTLPGFARGSIIANRIDTKTVPTGRIVTTETSHMKIISLKLNQKGGFALLLTILITGLVGLMLVAYLSLLSSSNQAVMRSQAWNSAMPMIEAGLEDALSQLNAHGSTNLACDGWTQSGGVYSMNRALGHGAYYVSISNLVAPRPTATTGCTLVPATAKGRGTWPPTPNWLIHSFPATPTFTAIFPPVRTAPLPSARMARLGTWPGMPPAALALNQLSPPTT